MTSDADGNAAPWCWTWTPPGWSSRWWCRAPSSDVSGVAAWTGDGDRLVGVDDGQLFVLDARTGTTTRPDLGLPPGSHGAQLALRSS